ncbi:MAG TPA: ATP-binding protein [Polyangia bacterium]|nr:ATP-binding protein [Polyangia bacterium]
MRAAPNRWFVALAVGLIVGFVASTLFIERKMARIDGQVSRIVANAAPSIRELAAARSQMRHVELGVGRYLGAHLTGRRFDRAQLERWRAEIDQHLATYATYPFIPGEREIFDELEDAKRKVFDDVDRALASIDAGDVQGARAVVFSELDPDAERLDAVTSKLVSANARFAEEAAHEISHIRRRTALVALVLDGITVTFGLLLLALVLRAARIYQAIAEARRETAELRAYELDHFASRVAHDLKGPLTSIMMGASALELYPEKTPALLPRMKRGASMMSAMVDTLLDFARAGAQPEAGGSTQVAPVLDELIAEVSAKAEEAGAALRVEAAPSCAVACGTGVLACVLSNLLENAIKYLEGGCGERAITVRVRDCGRTVRLEVQDTGPGLDEAMQTKVFLPYVRAGNAQGKPGLGLGLATVKRLVEAHGGSLGVRSRPGAGSCFWVELPRAPHSG